MLSRKIRHLLGTAFPITVVYSAEMVISLTDGIFAGRIGADALAGVSLAGGLFFAFVYAAYGVTSTSSVLITKISAKDLPNLAPSILVSGIVSALILALPILLLGFFVPDIMTIFSSDSAVLAYGSDYVTLVAWSIFFSLLFNLYRCVISSIGNGQIIIGAIVVGIIVNISCNYLLVFGLFDPSYLGVLGIATATIISKFVIFAILATYIHYRIFPLRLSRMKFSKTDKRFLAKYFKIGSPLAVLGLFESGFFAIILSLSSMFGSVFLAAAAIVLQVVDVVSSISLGIGDSATIHVSKFTVQKRATSAKIISFWATFYATLFTTGICALAFVFSDEVVSIFIGAGDLNIRNVQIVTSSLLGVGVFVVFFDAAQIVMLRSLKGVEDTFIPMCFSLIGYWLVGLGASLALSFYTTLGGVGIWIGLAFGLFATTLALTIRFVRKRKLA